MKNISLDITKAEQFLKPGTVEAYEGQVKAAQEALENGTCPGNDFLGWLHLPSSITPAFLDEVQAVANTIRQKCEVVVVAGIGGSYLGARAVIEALGNSFAWLVEDKNNPTSGLGMSIRNLTQAEQARLDVNGGILVQDVKRGGLASLSNIVAGDVIIQVNGIPITNSQMFAKTVAALPKNSVARVAIIRQGQRAILGLRLP